MITKYSEIFKEVFGGDKVKEVEDIRDAEGLGLFPETKIAWKVIRSLRTHKDFEAWWDKLDIKFRDEVFATIVEIIDLEIL